MEYLYKLMNRSHDKSLSPSNVTGMSLPNSVPSSPVSAMVNNNEEVLSKSVSDLHCLIKKTSVIHEKDAESQFQGLESFLDQGNL